MTIAVVGTGYVGLVTGTCFAETGHQVLCMDVDKEKIEALREGSVPIFEPGLTELVVRNQADGRLSFATDLKRAVAESRIIFVAVGTPSREDGLPDVSVVEQVCEEVAGCMEEYRILVLKSTVPVGTAEAIRERLKLVTDVPFDIVSNPEFLKEGAAVEDFMKPDRVVVGSVNREAADEVADLYAPFLLRGAPVLLMDPRSAEMTKYASNAMLACRISCMNEIANLCEHLGADIQWVRKGIGLDSRIGPAFLFPGVGYGGSCFPKDVRGLVSQGKRIGYTPRLIAEIDRVNHLQSDLFVDKMIRFFGGDLVKDLEGALEGGKTIPSHLNEPGGLGPGDLSGLEHVALRDRRIAVWGLAFKPRTNDMREAPSTRLVPRLIELGARVWLYDPEALGEAWKVFGDTVEYATSSLEALERADALALFTEWNLFRHPDFDKMKEAMRLPVIFDGRNQYSRSDLVAKGFVYFGVGQ